MDTTQAQPLLLPRSDGVVPGVVDFRGGPASRASTGRWSAAMFVLGTAALRSLQIIRGSLTDRPTDRCSLEFIL